MQDNLYKSNVDNENQIAIKHITNKGGKYNKPSFGVSGNLVKLETRFKTEQQRLPTDEKKKKKIHKDIAKVLPKMKGIQNALRNLSKLREQEEKQLKELENEIRMLKQTII